jgi:tetratricopeptide (TPR) repeat protein
MSVNVNELIHQVHTLNQNQAHQQVLDLLSENVLKQHQHKELYFEKGYALEHLNNYEAWEEYSSAIQIDHKFAKAFAARGRLSLKAKEYYYARKDLLNAVELEPQNSEYQYLLGDFYATFNEHYRKAVEHLSRAIALQSNYEQALFRRGELNYNYSKYDNAINDLNKVILINPEHARAYNYRGLCFYYQKQWDAAIDDFSNTIRIKPDFHNAWHNRGNAWQEKKEYDKALADLDESTRLEPNYYRSYEARGSVYHEQKDYENAFVNYCKAAGLNHDKQAIWFAMYKVIVEWQEAHLSECTYDIILDEDSDADLAFARAFIYYHSQDYYETIAECNKALARQDEHPMAKRYKEMAEMQVEEKPEEKGHNQRVREKAAAFLKGLRDAYGQKFKTQNDGFVNENGVGSWISEKQCPRVTGILGWLPAFRPDLAKWHHFETVPGGYHVDVTTLDGEIFLPELAGIPISKDLWEGIINAPQLFNGDVLGSRIRKFQRIGLMMDQCIEQIKNGLADYGLLFYMSPDE